MSILFERICLDEITCRYFMSGKCQDKELCNCPHIDDPNRVQDTICRYFLKGFCKYAHRCKWDHVFVRRENGRDFMYRDELQRRYRAQNEQVKLKFRRSGASTYPAMPELDIRVSNETPRQDSTVNNMLSAKDAPSPQTVDCAMQNLTIGNSVDCAMRNMAIGSSVDCEMQSLGIDQSTTQNRSFMESPSMFQRLNYENFYATRNMAVPSRAAPSGPNVIKSTLTSGETSREDTQRPLSLQSDYSSYGRNLAVSISVDSRDTPVCTSGEIDTPLEWSRGSQYQPMNYSSYGGNLAVGSNVASRDASVCTSGEIARPQYQQMDYTSYGQNLAVSSNVAPRSRILESSILSNKSRQEGRKVFLEQSVKEFLETGAYKMD